MTFRTETARDSTIAMRALVVIFIIVVALWASTGGLDRMLAEAPPSATEFPASD